MKKYIVTLGPDERTQLLALTHSRKTPSRKLRRAQLLLKADTVHPDARWTDAQISDAYQMHSNTVAEVRKRFVFEGLDAALHSRRGGHRPRALDGDAEAHLIALTCSPAPDDHDHWTLRLLAERMIQLAYVEHVSHETVRQTLKKMNLSRG